MRLGAIVIIENNAYHVNGASGVVIGKKKKCFMDAKGKIYKTGFDYEVLYGVVWETSKWQKCTRCEHIDLTVGLFNEDNLVEVSYDSEWKRLLDFSEWKQEVKDLLVKRTYELVGL